MKLMIVVRNVLLKTNIHNLLFKHSPLALHNGVIANTVVANKIRKYIFTYISLHVLSFSE